MRDASMSAQIDSVGRNAMAFQGRLPLAMLFLCCRGGVGHNPVEGHRHGCEDPVRFR
jgi:hypothetical protein